jgi:hypothetical protein
MYDYVDHDMIFFYLDRYNIYRESHVVSYKNSDITQGE